MGGGASEDYGLANYNTGYQAAKQGIPFNADPNHPEYGYAKAGYEAGMQELQAQSALEELMASFAMPEFPSFENMGPDPTAYLANVNSSYSMLNDAFGGSGGLYGWSGGQWNQINKKGPLTDYEFIYTNDGSRYARSDFDQAMNTRMEAANQAIAYADSLIKEQQSNANLMGMDYSITPEERQQLINDYFATSWSEQSESQLAQLANIWGVDLDTGGVTRGNPENVASTLEASKDQVSTSRGLKPKKTTTTALSEETLGQSAVTALGA